MHFLWICWFYENKQEVTLLGLPLYITVIYEKSETLAFEHWLPVNENGKPPDSINRSTVLFEKYISHSLSRPPDMSVTWLRLTLHKPGGTGGGCPTKALLCFGRAWFITRYLRYPFFRECRWGPRHFWSYQACLGYGPAPSSHVKKSLWHSGMLNKYQLQSQLGWYTPSFKRL